MCVSLCHECSWVAFEDLPWVCKPMAKFSISHRGRAKLKAHKRGGFKIRMKTATSVTTLRNKDAIVPAVDGQLYIELSRTNIEYHSVAALPL